MLSIPWHKPVLVTVWGVGERWVCRICIADHGLKGSEITRVAFAFERHEDAVRHINENHKLGTIFT